MAVRALEDKKLRKIAILTLARIKSNVARKVLIDFKKRLSESDDPEDSEGVKFIDYVFSDKFEKHEDRINSLRKR